MTQKFCDDCPYDVCLEKDCDLGDVALTSALLKVRVDLCKTVGRIEK